MKIVRNQYKTKEEVDSFSLSFIGLVRRFLGKAGSTQSREEEEREREETSVVVLTRLGATA